MAAFTKSMLSLLFLMAASNASPLTPRAETVFSLTDLVFNTTNTYSSPPHISIYSSSISFTLTNTAISRSSKCHVVSNNNPADIFFDGNQAFVCDGGVSSFKFKAVHINDGGFTVQDDTGVSGTGTPEFTCVYTDVINPDWPNTSPYKVSSSSCTQAELLIAAA
ncbi:hypothetical protein HYFRA_00000114 [Hymenoscyphus fraxineus]|uniref:AA1-like domain-containing protein n=1 Tax=Hymenoscyphus fraxineus TaxID=746836 RepID=A0A9N9L0Z9_9HELO|nr:hypothetical protein HYFRA_00000114 [Hymenoscyphus fraxineus]